MGATNNRGSSVVPPEPARAGGVRDLADCQPAAARAVRAGRSLTVPVLSRLFIFNAVCRSRQQALRAKQGRNGGGVF